MYFKTITFCQASLLLDTAAHHRIFQEIEQIVETDTRKRPAFGVHIGYDSALGHLINMSTWWSGQRSESVSNLSKLTIVSKSHKIVRSRTASSASGGRTSPVDMISMSQNEQLHR